MSNVKSFGQFLNIPCPHPFSFQCFFFSVCWNLIFFRLVRFRKERPVVGDFLGNIILAVPPPSLLSLLLSFDVCRSSLPRSVHLLLLSGGLACSSGSCWHLLQRLGSIVLDAESSQLFERFFWTHFQVWCVVFWLFYRFCWTHVHVRGVEEQLLSSPPWAVL